MDNLTILIVNWNSKNHLRKCLYSIRDFGADLYPRIIVVDGASYDGCDEMLASEFPDVVFVQSPNNCGFGRSNNLGFELVDTEFLLLLNPDTELTPDSLQNLLGFLSSNLDAGAAGPRLLNPDGSLQTSSVMAFPTPLNQCLDSSFLRRVFPRSSLWKTHEAYSSHQPVQVDAVSGACILTRTSVFREVGAFTPSFFMYGEDLDLCWKIKSAGKKIFHVPASTVVHYGGGSSENQPSMFSEIMKRDAISHYMELNKSKFTAFFYQLLQGVSAIVRLPPLLLANFTSKRAENSNSLRKWTTILRWSLGKEPWARSLRIQNILPAPQENLPHVS